MCDCIKLNQEALKEHEAEWNTALEIPFTINFKTGQFAPPRLTVGTRKADDSKRKKPVTLFASYCPFCGEKYQDAQ